MEGKGIIKVFETPDLVCEALANFIVGLSKQSIELRGRMVIALSGGKTPAKLYALLAAPAFKHQINWSKTFIFWGDERCVPEDDERNNSFMARLMLLKHVDIPAANIYPVPVDLVPEQAALAYEETIEKFYAKNPVSLDLILLGLGENGHTASLFPETPVLRERKRLVKEVFLAEQQIFRITMTAPLINQAKNIAFLVMGKDKAPIIKTVLKGASHPYKYPAQMIKSRKGDLYWFIDNAAANELS